jgi:putative ubiquitin-RnfH superfamily antitoxin RatB of RatAB toxin-antitoxin module
VNISVVYALHDRQTVRVLDVAEGTTLGEALERSGLLADFPEIDPLTAPVGVHGRIAARDTILHDGDRVEIYRPLNMEPKEARRKRQRKG